MKFINDRYSIRIRKYWDNISSLFISSKWSSTSEIPVEPEFGISLWVLPKDLLREIFTIQETRLAKHFIRGMIRS